MSWCMCEGVSMEQDFSLWVLLIGYRWGRGQSGLWYGLTLTETLNPCNCTHEILQLKKVVPPTVSALRQLRVAQWRGGRAKPWHLSMTWQTDPCPTLKRGARTASPWHQMTIRPGSRAARHTGTKKIMSAGKVLISALLISLDDGCGVTRYIAPLSSNCPSASTFLSI